MGATYEQARDWVLALPGGQEVMLAEDPETFKFAAYVGRFGWVEVVLSRVDPEHLHELIIEAWKRTAPKKLVKEYEALQG